MFQESHHTSKGFTLIELLVVIAIIGVLSSVVLASLNSAREKARDANRVAQLKQVQKALELYYATNDGYPAGDPEDNCTSIGWQTPLAPLVSGGFISSVPFDPINSSPFCYAFTGQTTETSIVRCEGSRRTDFRYSILFALENDTDAFPKVTAGAGTGLTHCILGEQFQTIP